jgi:hypothetical protein
MSGLVHQSVHGMPEGPHAPQVKAWRRGRKGPLDPGAGRSLFCRFLSATENRTFAKTGSGQTLEKLRGNGADFCRRGALQCERGKKTHLLQCHLIPQKMITLPRQARDTHREHSKKERDALSQVEPHLALELTERLIRLALESTPEDEEAAEEFELDENGECPDVASQIGPIGSSQIRSQHTRGRHNDRTHAGIDDQLVRLQCAAAAP